MVLADTPRPPDPREYRPLPLDRGLHLLGSRFRLAFTEGHADQLLQHLDEYIRLTEAAAAVRKRPYQLAQPARLFRRTSETEWERALWAEYRVSAEPQRPLLPEICGPVLTYQTMLRNTNKDEGWGEVDLLGLRPLRSHRSSWNSKTLAAATRPCAGSWKVRPTPSPSGRRGHTGCGRIGSTRSRSGSVRRRLSESRQSRRPSMMSRSSSPRRSRTWKRRIGAPLTHTNGRVSPDAWPVLRALISALGERGIRIVCASLRAGMRTKGGKPQQVIAEQQALPDEPILQVAAEGSSVSVYGWPLPDHSWWFRVSTNEAGLKVEDERATPEASPRVWVADWDAVLPLLDKWPWAMFYPLYVNPAFRDAVLRDSQVRAGEHFRLEAWSTAASADPRLR